MLPFVLVPERVGCGRVATSRSGRHPRRQHGETRPIQAAPCSDDGGGLRPRVVGQCPVAGTHGRRPPPGGARPWPTGPTRPGLRSRSGSSPPATATPSPLPSLTWKVGPEMLDPTEEKTAPLPAEGLSVKAAGLKEPGFLRLVATATLEGQDYRALATAGFAPDKIAPTVDQPADFDAFWAAGKEALAKLPVDAKLVPMPEVSNGKVDCWHVSLQNVGPGHDGHEPLLRRALRAQGRRALPGAAAGAGRGRAGLPRRRGDGGEGHHHAPGGHPRPPRQPRPHGLRSARRAARSRATRPSTSTSATATTTGACTWAACGPTTSS